MASGGAAASEFHGGGNARLRVAGTLIVGGPCTPKFGDVDGWVAALTALDDPVVYAARSAANV